MSAWCIGPGDGRWSRQPDSARGGGLTHSAMEAIAAVVIFAIGVVMMIDNYRIGAGWAPDGPESGYFPFRIGAILCFASVVVLFQSVYGKQRSARSSSPGSASGAC